MFDDYDYWELGSSVIYVLVALLCSAARLYCALHVAIIMYNDDAAAVVSAAWENVAEIFLL